jgi:hypothetical protein
MPEKHLFEYAVIRVVPHVEREEFINVGVILYCPSKAFLQTNIEINKERLFAFADDIDFDDLEKNLDAFKLICKGGSEGGPIGKLPLASRFRWLTATRSTIIQTSPVHLGVTAEPQEKLYKLFKQLVGNYSRP